MIKTARPLIFIFVLAVLLLGFGLLLHGLIGQHTLAILQPKGQVAIQERNLIFLALGLMLLVVIPVFILTFYIAWHFRADNKKARYQPEWDHHLGLEFIWWAIPSAIILTLSIITWTSSHALDPFKPLSSATKPLTIQVIALDWKWLFLYPEQHIASLNLVEFPQGTPLNFEITADAPMNSFWIPELGGQIYAMPGMSTQLHLIADQPGEFAGSSANISGSGFAEMRFTAKATSQAEFDQWVNQAQASRAQLDSASYFDLSQPSTHNAVATYRLASQDLYNQTMMKFMLPAATRNDHQRTLPAHTSNSSYESLW